MGWERVTYKGKYFDYNNGLISWVQKFMELYLSKEEHPEWFNDFLEYIGYNFHVPHGKAFFEESMINNDPERLAYAIDMIDKCIVKMNSINKREFIEYIKENIKGSWCDLNPYPNQSWFDENETYYQNYLGVLIELKKIIQP